MATTTGLRLHVVASPGDPLENALLDLLWACADRVPTRGINIGNPYLAGTRWVARPDLWTQPAPANFVNVVIAPLYYQQGVTTTLGALRGTLAAPTPADLEVVFRPLSIWTACRQTHTYNVAVVLPGPHGRPEHVAALESYDRAWVLHQASDDPLLEHLRPTTPLALADYLAQLCAARDQPFTDH